MVDFQTSSTVFRSSSLDSSSWDAVEWLPDPFQRNRRRLEAIEFELRGLHERVKTESTEHDARHRDVMDQIKRLHGKKKNTHLALEILESRPLYDLNVTMPSCGTEQPRSFTPTLPDAAQDTLRQRQFENPEPRLN